MEIITTIYLDFSRKTTPVIVYAKEFDNESRYLSVIPLDNGATLSLDSGFTAKLRVVSEGYPSSSIEEEAADATISQRTSSLVFPLTKRILTPVGVKAAEIKITSGSSVLTSEKFYLNIENAVDNEERMQRGWL